MPRVKREVTRDRERTVYSMRLAGKDWDTISQTVHMSVKGAQNAFGRALQRFSPLPDDKRREQEREVDINRCEALWEQIQFQLDTPQGVLAALKVLERRARLLGLDEPSASVSVDQRSVNIYSQLENGRQIAASLQERFGKPRLASGE